MPKRILIVEDERDVVRLLSFNLTKEGFRVSSVSDGTLVLPEIRRDQPDLVLLDLMLPGMGGLEICRQLRRHEKFGSIPILMLTARSEESDRVVGLEIGADDYVTKPFSMRELIARVHALLRRREPAPQGIVQRGDFYIDPQSHAVKIGGRPVDLSALEFRLLYYLACHPGMVFSRDQLLDRVWGNERAVTSRSVDVYIRRIREKIETQSDAPAYVQTVHGVGYRFASDML